MNSAETLAITKAVKKKAADAARANLAVGKHEVDTVVRIHGTLTVGEDYDKTPTTSIPILDAMALLVHDAGITGPAALKALTKAMTRALNQDEDAKETIAAMRESLATAEKAVKATLKTLPPVTCKGPVTTSLTVEEQIEAADEIIDATEAPFVGACCNR